MLITRGRHRRRFVGHDRGRARRDEHADLLWARRPELAEQINAGHVNGDYLADFQLPEAAAGNQLASRRRSPSPTSW